MLVRRVTLDNVRCFAANATIDFTHEREDQQPHKWVVIYGDNGVGKSTLLRAIGLALTGQPALNHLVPSAEGWVRRGKTRAKIAVEITKSKLDIGRKGVRQRPIDVEWTIVGTKAQTIDGAPRAAHSVFLNESGDGKPDANLFTTYIASDERAKGWLVCGYGPHRRLSGPSSEMAEVPVDGRAARLITLFQEKAALSSGERWLKDLHHESLRTKSVDRELEAVTQMLNNGLLHEGVRLTDISEKRVVFETPFAKDVPMADLSDGYRTTLGFALDLLRRISYSFELSEVIDTSGEHALVTAEGVVLIDEIDSHLHPSWQRTIGEWLHTRFPNLQFIVATHSPLIPSCVKGSAPHPEGMIVRLIRASGPRSESVVRPEVDLGRVGLTADQNLTGPNFGLASTRDVIVDDLYAEIRKLTALVRSKKATPAQRENLKQLQFDFDRLAPAVGRYQDVGEWESETDRLRALSESLAGEPE